MKRLFTLICLLGLVIAGSGLYVAGVSAQGQQQCFPETGKCVSGRFLQYWQQNGGLPVFGYPLTNEQQENGFTVQYFERQRFELHPENQAPYDVLLGRLGAEVLQRMGTDWSSQPKATGPMAGCTYFPETQHNVCNQQGNTGFLNYWQTHGLEFNNNTSKDYRESLALFGYPITEVQAYTASDGKSYQAQWFERARFEWHPNEPNPYKVLLGRLGAEALASQPTTPPEVNNAGAVQTLVNYYSAIEQKKYDEAYHIWANNGAASGLTLEQFKQGLANTVRTDVAIGYLQGVNTAADHVILPVTITAVVNDPSVPDLGQRVQVFTGTYTVQQADSSLTPTGFVIAAAHIAEVSNPKLPPAERSAPEQLVQAYYNAINQHEFAHAYTLWDNSGTASNQGFAQFQTGFANTNSVAIAMGTPQVQGAAGSLYADVPIVIVATQKDQTQQTFCGTYTARRLNVPPFDQLGWYIQRGNITQTSNVQLGSAEANALLNGGCPVK
ncbi:MAG TPA: hypothetical protein VFT66_25230 [Roseiflexaceae bacterium]|jgi:hypothetical protein|nr:hypothetical protein [Roseiflexaceae bacterium]